MSYPLYGHARVLDLTWQVSIMIFPISGAILEGKIVSSLLVELMRGLIVALQACVAERLLPNTPHVRFAEDLRRLGLQCPSKYIRALSAVCVVLALQ